METRVKTILQSALLDKSSKIYLSKNVKTIKKHLWTKGIEVEEEDIKEFLLTQKSFSQTTTNTSRRKIAEVSKPFVGQQSFFAQVHSDICVLSKKRSYYSSSYMILTVIEALTNFIYLEKVRSTSFNDISAALERIFKRSPYLPEDCNTFVSDRGVEYTSRAIKEFMKSIGISMNYVNARPIRGSKGSGIAEVQNRRLRRHLEALIKENDEKKPLEELLRSVEKIMNSEGQSALGGLSSKEALGHDAKYISMLRSSLRFKKRKYLKEEMTKKKDIKLYSIVRIRNYNDKKVFEKKESYGILSQGLFIVIEVKVDDFITYYRLGSLFSMKPIANSVYTYYELKLVPMSYARACYVESINNVGAVLKNFENGYMEYTTVYDATVFYGPKEIMKLK